MARACANFSVRELVVRATGWKSTSSLMRCRRWYGGQLQPLALGSQVVHAAKLEAAVSRARRSAEKAGLLVPPARFTEICC